MGPLQGGAGVGLARGTLRGGVVLYSPSHLVRVSEYYTKSYVGSLDLLLIHEVKPRPSAH